MTGITWKPVSIVSGLLLLLTYFFHESRSPDVALCARMQEALQALQLRDAELTRDTLLVRAELLPSHDSLAPTTEDLFRVLGILRLEGANSSGQVAQVVNRQIEALSAALQEKATRLENFKSDVATLRNSVLYFDSAGKALRTRGEGDAELMAKLGELSHAMLHFMRAPDAGSAQEIEALLDLFSSSALSQTEPRALIAHGGLISQVLPQVDSQLREILAVPTAARARALQEALLHYSKRVEARAEVFRFLLYSAALVLLGYLTHQFRRLRSNALELRRANAELSREKAGREQDFVTGIIRDITVRKHLEETARQQKLQLIQANKMTALGTLVSGVAHEINNPNQLVLTSSEVLARVWDDVAKVLDRYRHQSGEFTLAGLAYGEMRATIPILIHDVHASALRIGQIVGDLKDFARPRARGAVGVFQLNDAVKRALRLLRHLIDKRTTRLRTDLAPRLPVLSGDVRQMEQVVVNLLVNALEALPDRERGVSVSTSYDAGEGSVVLEVRDEGIGISRKHLQHLCEPFFTTKAESGGTGLGLAITSTLIRAHDGRLAFDSEPGRGTRAQVRLPCHAERASADTKLAA